jgi:hypothetical protein
LSLGALIALTVDRWSRDGWMPVHSEHVPTDFASLTVNGIPIEVLYGPDAERHPYRLSEPDEFPPLLMDGPLVQPPSGGYFSADRAAWLASQRMAAQVARPDSFRIISGL